MQTLYPPIIQNHSPGDSTAQPANNQDPYLSGPSDLDEDFTSTGIRRPPSQGASSNHHPTPDGSSPSSDLHVPSASAPGIGAPVVNSDDVNSTSSRQQFLSPSDLNARTPPNDDLAGGLGMSLGSGQNSSPHSLSVPGNAENLLAPTEFGFGQPRDSHLLSPDLTNHHTPASEASPKNRFASPSAAQRALHSDLGSSDNGQSAADTLNVQTALDPASTRARSPIVKIESVSRGDSPDRSYYPGVRRHSQSSAHLSPGNADESDEEYVPEQNGASSNPVPRFDDGSWVPNAATGHGGVDPASRTGGFVASPREMESRRQLDDKNAVIRYWTESVSAANSDAGDDAPGDRGRRRKEGSRRRAISAGDSSHFHDYFNFKRRVNDSNIPGPGVLIYENSNDGSSDLESELTGSESASPAASVNQAGWDQTSPEIVAEPEQQSIPDELPSPSQFIRKRLSPDLAQESPPETARIQPQSSNAAIADHWKRLAEFDNISRIATWGTQDLYESLDNMSIHDDKNNKKERRPSFFNLSPVKTATDNFRKRRFFPQMSAAHPSGDVAVNRRDSGPPERKESFPRKFSVGSIGKPHQRSPSLNTPSAIVAMTGQIAAVGGRGSVGGPPSGDGPSPGIPPQKPRERSRSELPNPSSKNLIDMMTTHGGPPVPSLAYLARTTTDNAGMETREAQLEHDAGPGPEEPQEQIVIDLPFVSRLPVPTQEGFKSQVAQLNPRLRPDLADRFANEQLRRYRLLVESKSNHSRAARSNMCTAGRYCFVQGGDATLLPPRPGAQDTDTAPTQYQIPRRDEANDDAESLSDGAVTSAQFPDGVPPPPVKRLPAVFECPICFTVKKFQKPSDWTKHIQEDLQPFTCTFPDCSEPSSFKRKADWVRHENERHRKLEWWTCEVHECHHTCYRRNNFVQHLVREHKIPDPAARKTKVKGKNGNVIRPEVQEAERQREQEVERFWEMVDRCHHVTDRTPRDEPCRFCGNICGNWKKLTVHLAKHMEQIAMPVLHLVGERDFLANVDARPVNDASISGSATKSGGSSYLAPCQGDAQDGSTMGLSAVQAEYNDPGRSTTPLDCPMITMPNGVMSAEPESMDPLDMPQFPQFGVSGASGPGDQAGYAQFAPIQLNSGYSASHPPPFNAVPRPRSNQGMELLQDPYHYQVSMPSAEMAPAYDTQPSLYAPPAAGSNYPSGQAVPYDPSNGADYLNPRGGNYM